ncbi:multiple epidermal growth factor-like domains protein 10 isoform X2 [Strongylocentrotus purpuratus]|uniref:EGF-like domain-containing protein n=1 Tax=Strongylocentrotus purpuratus TaxID=7668 RepID=A0A7M7T470_STRPU|nr:multiple epidermal growth factor-like domains protein 10 isoform X2 [Strongylocentrotus purpuratus]
MQKFGWDCEFECGPGQPLDKCAGSQICLPDPYGCSCLAGYTGIYCNETCGDGMFGADCLQKCNCTDGADCDDVTGQCTIDCSQGWSGSACQESDSTGGTSSSSIATVVGSAVGAIVVIVIVIILIIFLYKRRSDESATTKSKGKESDTSPQYENPVFDQSKTDVHTYQDINTDTNTYQDINTADQSYEDLSDPHTYQDLKKPDQEANYEELNDARNRDYVNVPGI